MDPKTASLQFYLDGELIDAYTPMDSSALIDAWLEPWVGIWVNKGVSIKAYVDDVRIAGEEQ